jgi:hypothetical protein
MKLLDEIIELAVDDSGPIGTLLRKCLVLESQARNEKFKSWLNKELDGYNSHDELPTYREFVCVNKGYFIGMVTQLHDQPLTMGILEKEDRERVRKVRLHQPVASYAGRPDKSSDGALAWPPDLTTKYQTKFFKDGDLVLNRAWQEIPGSVLVGLLEQVRTRVLRFALELKDNLPNDTQSVASLPAAVIERSVVNNIYGGNIVIAAHAENFAQISSVNVAQGDIHQLEAALKSLGLDDDAIKKLESAMDDDASQGGGAPTLGQRTLGWLKNAASYTAKEGLEAGFEVAKKAATKWVMQHYGLDI